MVSRFTSELLSSVTKPTAHKVPLAMLCLSTSWGMREEQILALAAELHKGTHAVTLIVAPGSALHQQAQAHQVPCFTLPVRWKSFNLWSARVVARWLERQQISVLMTTWASDLAFANFIKAWGKKSLRLLHRQLEPLPTSSALPAWWLVQQVMRVDAWLAPSPRLARQLQAQAHVDMRRMWIVPPALLPEVEYHGHGLTQTARNLLDLPEHTHLIGVLDCGGDGPAFAIEALYRMRQEHGCAAELVLMGGPDTPPELGRWAKLRELAHQLRMDHCVHLRPLHNASTPILFYRALDVLLLPTEADATGLNLLRAMTSCCPLVSVAAADALDLLEEQRTAAHLFARGDVAACARALADILAVPGPARRMAQWAATLVGRQCSPQRQRHQVEAIIDYISRHEVVVS
ncbi:glycosyltransferase [Hymenobacter sp. GOD-10R]|uniref:glycosyltransferase n=1 Tax=Hymenobacter sp. GOD-10R TaxID=3093922 RepID=UPI002D7882ED|nr:glycosyltransferase [Hymenobacter sp. GOD-10R]WRQ29262.1 glycosyltransferase [Hymenobacter sp. GOD-10R]